MIPSGAIAGYVAVQTSPTVMSKHAELNLSPLARCVRQVQNNHRQLLIQNPEKADFLTVLKEKLAERAGGVGMTEGNHTSQTLKPWQVELAKAKAEFANSAPERKAAEAKEDKRVADALNAEAAENAKQKAAEAEKASKAPVALKLDVNGVPLPPPPPPPPMNPAPQKFVNISCGMNKMVAGEQGKKSSEKSVQDAVLGELARKLAERAGNVSVVDITLTDQVLKPWQLELARVKAEFANSAPERKMAEAKEEARVAAALNAEAAEKDKQKAVEAEKAKRAPVTFKLDANGIPIPPPPPPPPAVNHIPTQKFIQTKL